MRSSLPTLRAETKTEKELEMQKIFRSGVVLIFVGFFCLFISQYACAQSDSNLKSCSRTGTRHITGKIGVQEGITTYYFSFDGYELYCKDTQGHEIVDQVNVYITMLYKEWGDQKAGLYCQLLSSDEEKEGIYHCRIKRHTGDCKCNPGSVQINLPGYMREGFNSKELIEKAANLMHLRCGPRLKVK